VGFYDTTCMLTGVNLSSVGTTAVLLHMVGTVYQPITLGISGSYDGHGCIDEIRQDRNTELICKFFTQAHRSGRFDAHGQTHTDDADWFDPAIEIDSLLYLVERTTTCADIFVGGPWPASTVLDGHPVVFALIAQPVWDELTAHPPTRRAPESLLQYAFGDGAGIAEEIYAGHFDQVAEQVRQLAVISDFVNAPPGEPHQRHNMGVAGHYGERENRRFLEAARRDYRADPAIQAALDAYVRPNDYLDL
jgi:hypothetical protein